MDPTTEDESGIRHDPHDDRIAWYVGKRIYLGNNTQISRLFWLLASPIGRACSPSEVQRAVDGLETNADLGMSATELQNADQRVRKAISRLRKALREWGADAHLLIVVGSNGKDREYTMVFRHARERSGPSTAPAGQTDCSLKARLSITHLGGRCVGDVE